MSATLLHHPTHNQNHLPASPVEPDQAFLTLKGYATTPISAHPRANLLQRVMQARCTKRWAGFLALLPCVLCAVPSYDLSSLSLAEKVGQVLMTRLVGEDANEEAQHLIQDLGVGAVVYYKHENGLDTMAQISALSHGLQDLALHTPSQLPLLIAADQEGGRVCRLPAMPEVPALPSARSLAITAHSEEITRWGSLTARALLRAGIVMNLAPVVDVDSGHARAYMAARTYSSSPSIVVQCAAAMMRGHHAEGVATCLKHYPGLGESSTDPHLGLPVLKHSYAEMLQRGLYPFHRLAHETDAIMTAHLMVPALDPTCCTTLSEPSIRHLRENLGFRGLLIADSLHMHGVLTQTKTLEEAAIRALQAGCDLLILGGAIIENEHSSTISLKDIDSVHSALMQAVQSGRVPQARLDEAVDRILRLKQKLFASKP